MLNFACYLDGDKHSGPQFDLQTHFRFLVVNVSRKTNYLTLDNKLINNSSELITHDQGRKNVYLKDESC